MGRLVAEFFDAALGRRAEFDWSGSSRHADVEPEADGHWRITIYLMDRTMPLVGRWPWRQACRIALVFCQTGRISARQAGVRPTAQVRARAAPRERPRAQATNGRGAVRARRPARSRA